MQEELFSDITSMNFTEKGCKVCKSCGVERPIELMPHFWYKADGTSSKGNVCNICRSKQKRIVSNLKKTIPEPDPNYKCPVCQKKKEELPTKRMYWVLDHCHKTNSFRGWLCNTCNSALGWLEDDINYVRRAIYYLEKHEEDS